MRVATRNVLWRFEPDWRAGAGNRGDPRAAAAGLQECSAADAETQADRIAARLGGHATFAGSPLPPVRPSTPSRRACGWESGW